ncbi:MAG: hypothetical protein LBH25_05645 [Fibromonadaceae bacterium]|nr:hypothetical protein [Fibromonadaceae bacterium]
MTSIWLKARTGEEMYLKFEDTVAVQLNDAPANRKETVHWYDITSKIHINITIPSNRPKPQSVIVKLDNTINCEYYIAEYREVVLKGYARYEGPTSSYFQTETGGVVARYYYSQCQCQCACATSILSMQTVEFTLDFGNRKELLICPINGTSKFGMCFYSAYIARQFVPSNPFSPSIDGYSFINTASSFGYSSTYAIPLERYTEVFGPVQANAMYRGLWGGSCFSFASTVGLFYTNYLKVLDYKSETVFKIPVPKTPTHEVTKLIERYQLSWLLDGVGNKTNSSIDELLAAVSNFQNTRINPVIIVMFRSSGISTVGHSFLGYKVTQDSSGYAVTIYDCNNPGQTCTLKISADKKTWEYGAYNSKDPAGKISFLRSNTIGEKMLGVGDKGCNCCDPGEPGEPGEIAHPGEVVPGEMGSEKVYLSVSTGDVEIYNSNGVNIEEINGTERILMCDGQSHNDIAYYLPQDTYRIVPKSDAPSQEAQPFVIGVSDNETSISACNAVAFGATVSLGDEPQLDIESGSGEFELNVVTTNEDFSEDKVRVYKRDGKGGKGAKGGKGGKSSTVSFTGKHQASDGSQIHLKSDGLRKGKRNSKSLKFTFKLEQ